MSMQEVFNELDEAKGILGQLPGHGIGADLLLLAAITAGMSKNIVAAKTGLDTIKEHMPDYYGHANGSAARSAEASSHVFSAMLEISSDGTVNPNLSGANSYTVEVTKDGEAMVGGYQMMEEQLDIAIGHLRGLGEAVVALAEAQRTVEAARKDSERHAAAAVQKIDDYTQPLR